MKECKYCRTKYDDNLAACPSCGGAKVITEQEKAEAAALYQKEIENRESAVAVGAAKRKLLISALVGIVVVIVAVVALASYNANKPLSNGMTKDEGEAIWAEGIAFYNDGDYESAIGCFVQLPSDSKQYGEAQSMLEKCENEYSAIVIEKANGYAASNDYEMAIHLLNNAGEILLDNTAISTAYNTIFAEYKGIVCSNAHSESEIFASNGDYPSAITAIDKAIELVGQDDELTAKRDVYVDTYVSQIVSAAEAQYIEYNYESIVAAENMLTQALQICPSDKRLSSALISYKDKEPIRFFDISCADFGWLSGGVTSYKDFGAVADNQGVIHSNSISSNDWFSSRDYVYWRYPIDLDYQYTKLTGIIFQSERYAASTESTRLTIEGYLTSDIYESEVLWNGEVNGTLQPLSINVDISGYKYVLIRLIQEGRDSDAHHAYLTDFYVWK